jgi:peptidoglycan/LPS O-acetylase OafA/YrhL
MELYSFWPYFAITAIAMLLVTLLPFGGLDEPGASASRVPTIDGLRGFLALGVFAHHLSVSYVFLKNGVWQAPSSHLYAFLGQGSVALFFMITSFLFWGKLIKVGGSYDWVQLYVGRLFRIGPLYLAVVVVLLTIVFARTGSTLVEPLWRVAYEIAKWCTLGVLKNQPDVNGLRNTSLIVAKVIWTLHYEWLFYFSLILLSFFARKRQHLIFSVGALCLLLAAAGALRKEEFVFAALFVAGMCAASLKRTKPRLNLAGPWYSILGCIALGAACYFFPSAYGAPQILLLAGFFLLIAGGNTIFGLLLTRAAQRLGSISYSIYLTHGVLLTIAFSIPAVRAFAMLDPLHLWILGLVLGPILTMVASLTYLLIEKPGIALGKRILGGRRRDSARPARDVREHGDAVNLSAERH